MKSTPIFRIFWGIVKLAASFALAILSPLVATAGIAGDWAGTLALPQRSVPFALHIAGPDTELKATHGPAGAPVPSITFSGSTLQFGIPLLDVTFSGDLLANGTIVGTFLQHGKGLPLILERVAAPSVTPAPAQPIGSLRNGRYHHNPTGVEFDVPSGWTVVRPRPPDDPTRLTVLLDPTHKSLIATVNMETVDVAPADIPVALSRAVPLLLGMRSGQTGAAGPHVIPDYAIRPGSVEQTLIAGQQAVRAIGEYERGGKKFAELLTWIYTPHTTTYFFARMPAEDLPYAQPLFEKILQSASIP